MPHIVECGDHSRFICDGEPAKPTQANEEHLIFNFATKTKANNKIEKKRKETKRIKPH